MVDNIDLIMRELLNMNTNFTKLAQEVQNIKNTIDIKNKSPITTKSFKTTETPSEYLFRLMYHTSDNSLVYQTIPNLDLAVLNRPFDDGNYPIHHATQLLLDAIPSDVEYASALFKLLINCNVNINVVNINGMTPLHMLLSRIPANLSAIYEYVELLINEGAIVNAINNNNTMPLHYACWNGYTPIVKLLIDANADVNVQGKYSSIPLITACHNQDMEIVKLLIDANADVNVVTDNGYTPLTYVINNNNIQLINILIEAGANVNFLNMDNGNSLLHYAIHNKCTLDCIKTLVDNAIPLDTINYNGQTALHIAALDLNEHVIELLINAGADIDIGDKNCDTVLEIVRKIKTDDIDDIEKQNRIINMLVIVCDIDYNNIFREIVCILTECTDSKLYNVYHYVKNLTESE